MRRPFVERFWSHVDRSLPFCWEWDGKRLVSGGYGVVYVSLDRRQERAHRVAWELTNGPIPRGMFVCHRCDNPPCVRPDHLFLGTHHQNMKDMDAKGRRLLGSKHQNARLNEADVRAIRDLGRTTPNKVIAAKYGVNRTTIYSILTRRTWSWLREDEQHADGGP